MQPFLYLLAAESHKAPPLIDIDWTIFVQFGIFLLLMLVLNTLVFKPYFAVQRERSSIVEEANTQATMFSGQAADKLCAYEEGVAAARRASQAEMTKVRLAGEEAAQEWVAKTRSAAELKQRETRHLLREKAPAVERELRQFADQLARDIATKVLGRHV